ncbi:MAG: undecaprenyl-phosphate galactose phosphotransferase WbaP [Proteobacteria bacterium]|nr:undecaprenyl-phosphate galactose phosphotransferase WbaP [Pseudomonadota bacterium]
MISAALKMLLDLFAFLICFSLGLLTLSVYGDYGFSAERWMPWWLEVGLPHLGLFLIFVIGILIRFFGSGLYHRNLTLWDETIKVWQTIVTFAVVHGFFTFVAKWPIAKSVFLVSWTSALILVPLLKSRTRNWFPRSKIVLLVSDGQGDSAARIAENLGYVAQETVPLMPMSEGRLKDVHALNQNFLIASTEQNFKNAQEWSESLSLMNKVVHLIPPLSGLPLVGAEIQPLMKQEALVLTLRHQMKSPISRFVKRSFDILGALFGLGLLIPFFLLTALSIRKTPGPVLFAHYRVGRNGRLFKCYKFRTMVMNAEDVLKALLEKDPSLKAEWERDFKLKNDPRITHIGSFLRKTSLDEIPQLWNILIGDMSLVGPRPVTEAEVNIYGTSAQFYKAVRPGLTGLWQISGRNDTTYQERVTLDSWYVKNWSIWYDIVIILETINVVLRRKGAY